MTKKFTVSFLKGKNENETILVTNEKMRFFRQKYFWKMNFGQCFVVQNRIFQKGFCKFSFFWKVGFSEFSNKSSRNRQKPPETAQKSIKHVGQILLIFYYSLPT
jgi:hypothetical protein